MEVVDPGPTREPAHTASAEPTEPPPLQIVPWLRVRSFEREDAGRVVRLTLVGELRAGSRPPKQAALIVRRGELATAFHPAGTSLERSGSLHRGARGVLRWTVTFSLPPGLVEDARASFRLAGDGRSAIQLPAPAAAMAEVSTVGARRAVSALASAAVVSVGALLISPAASLADGSGSNTQSTTVSSSTSTTTTDPTTTDPTTTLPADPAPASVPAPAPSPAPVPSPATTPSTTTAAAPTTTPAPSATTTPTTGGSSNTGKPSSESNAGSKPRPAGASLVDSAIGLGSKGSGGKGGSNPSNTCLPATAESYRLVGRPLNDATTSCTANHRKSKNSDASPSKPVYVSPNVVSFAPVHVPGSDQWGGSAMSNPFTSSQLQRYAQLVGSLSRPPRYLVRIYKAAARRYRLPWQVLAAINFVETGYGADSRVSSAGARGWMQFMPGTWARYGEVVDIRGRVLAQAASAGDAWNARDAIFSAARYLVANGAHANLPKAIYAYNHALWYVQEVLSVAEQIDRQGLNPQTHAGRRIAAMRTEADLLNGMPYVWGGGHQTWGVATGYDCSGFVSAVLHGGGYLSQPVTTQSLPLQNGIVSGPGRWITIFDRTSGGSLESDHVIIDIDGQWWESGGGSTSGGAADVHRIRRMNASYLQSFNLVLHPRGL